MGETKKNVVSVVPAVAFWFIKGSSVLQEGLLFFIHTHHYVTMPSHTGGETSKDVSPNDTFIMVSRNIWEKSRLDQEAWIASELTYATVNEKSMER